MRRAWAGRWTAPGTSGCKAGQALQLLALDLALEDGELARGPGVKTLGGLASLLQVGPKGGCLGLDVRPKRQEGVALGRELALRLGQDRCQGRLSVTLKAMRRRLDAHETDREGIDPITQGLSRMLAGG